MRTVEPKTLVVIDTETTGLIPGFHVPREIAAKVVQISPSLRVTVKPEFFHLHIAIDDKIPWQVWPAKEFDGREVGDASDAEQVYSLFSSYLQVFAPQPLFWAGCNPSFDRNMIEMDPRTKLGSLISKQLFHYRMIDVSSMMSPLWFLGGMEGTGLRHCRKWAGLEGEQSHTAMQDVDDTIVALTKYLGSFSLG